jgi:hypothetical protein
LVKVVLRQRNIPSEFYDRTILKTNGMPPCSGIALRPYLLPHLVWVSTGIIFDLPLRAIVRNVRTTAIGKPAIPIENTAAHPSGKGKVSACKLIKPVLGGLRHRKTVKGILREKALILVKACGSGALVYAPYRCVEVVRVCIIQSRSTPIRRGAKTVSQIRRTHIPSAYLLAGWEFRAAVYLPIAIAIHRTSVSVKGKICGI